MAIAKEGSQTIARHSGLKARMVDYLDSLGAPTPRQWTDAVAVYSVSDSSSQVSLPVVAGNRLAVLAWSLARLLL